MRKIEERFASFYTALYYHAPQITKASELELEKACAKKFPTCCAHSPNHFSCTLDKGHKGVHAAHGGGLISVWDRDDRSNKNGKRGRKKQ